MATTSRALAGATSKRPAVTTTFAGGSQLLMTIDGYSKLMEALDDARGSIESERFRAGGRSWYIEYRDEINKDKDGCCYELQTVYLCLDHAGGDDRVKARYELTLLDRSGEIIRATRDINNLSSTSDRIRMMLLIDRPELEDTFHVRCDVTVVEVTTVEPLFLHGDLSDLLATKLSSDVTFEVAGELFTAHRCVLAARSAVFKAEFFGPGKDNGAATRVRIDDMEPRVFKAFLHFIYTETLPKINKGDEVAMAIGLLVAAERYVMRRLGWICQDIFFFYADARTAVATLELANKHGCQGLREACIKSLEDLLAKEKAKLL